MRGNKNTIRWWVVLAVLFVVYNVVAFALPFHKTAVFVVSYLFTLVAIGAQIYVVRTAFYQGEGVKSKFYGFPIARIGVMYLAAQVVLGLVFMALGAHVPMWLPLVLYVLMLGAAAIGFIAADVMRDEVVRQDVKLVKDTSRMRELQAKAKMIAGLNTLPELAGLLEKLAETFRFSDPVSSEALMEIEERLAGELSQLQQAVTAQSAEQAAALCRQADALLAERNQLCKLNKGR